MKIVDDTNEGDLKTGDVEISQASITYIQEPDNCSSSEEYQRLEIHIEDAGGGKYIVLRTDRWAIDSIDDFITILRDFKQRIGVKGL